MLNSRPSQQRASFLAVLVALLASCQRACAWTRARSTWYDDNPSMSVHQGSCMYGYLGDRFGGEQNWMVGAINDGNWRYAGSCGRCFELKCVPGSFSDGYGNRIDRSNDCKSQEPVIIAITDTCPCYYPANAYSNKRWCCGDMEHFDIGIWAFRKMADPGKGVIMVDYRPVPCPAYFNNKLNPSVQKPSSLRNQYPYDQSIFDTNAQQQGSDSQQKVQAFNGPSQNNNGPSSSPSPSPSPPQPQSGSQSSWPSPQSQSQSGSPSPQSPSGPSQSQQSSSQSQSSQSQSSQQSTSQSQQSASQSSQQSTSQLQTAVSSLFQRFGG